MAAREVNLPNCLTKNLLEKESLPQIKNLLEMSEISSAAKLGGGQAERGRKGPGLRFAILLGQCEAVISAKEALILIGRKAGASVEILSEITGISSSAVSRRHDAAKSKMSEDQEMSKLSEWIEKQYLEGSN